MFSLEMVEILSNASWIVFIVAGIVSSLSFLARIALVFEAESLSEWLKFIAYSGFILGIIVLVVTAANFIGPHLEPKVSGKPAGWDVLILGLVTGFALSLKPIKDMKWAALGTLFVGASLMILIWWFVPAGPSWGLSALVLIFCFMIYMALKFIEDFYLLISEILTSPPVSVGLGILCVLQGVLLLFNSSLLSIAISF